MCSTLYGECRVLPFRRSDQPPSSMENLTNCHNGTESLVLALCRGASQMEVNVAMARQTPSRQLSQSSDMTWEDREGYKSVSEMQVSEYSPRQSSISTDQSAIPGRLSGTHRRISRDFALTQYSDTDH